MYTIVETDVSRRFLKILVSSIQRPYCLIGGWSVYLIVNDAYQEDTGREYQGSKDIDLGFHFDPMWDQKEFDSSPFAIAIATIRKMNFEGTGSRFFKEFHISDGHELTSKEARQLQSYDIFRLYIDPFVDSSDPKKNRMAKFPVAEELLLSEVFSGKQHLTKKSDGLEVIVPDPRIQMEMKMRSFPTRGQDDKKRKDLIDLCALILYSGFEPPTVGDEGGGLTAKTNYKLALKAVTEVEWKALAADLNLTVTDAKRVANRIG